MWSHAILFDAALHRVKAARAAADSNLGFATQLLRRQPRTGTAANSPGSARCILRLAPHSPCPLPPRPQNRAPSSSSFSSGASAADLLDSRRSSSTSSSTFAPERLRGALPPRSASAAELLRPRKPSSSAAAVADQDRGKGRCDTRRATATSGLAAVARLAAVPPLRLRLWPVCDCLENMADSVDRLRDAAAELARTGAAATPPALLRRHRPPRSWETFWRRTSRKKQPQRVRVVVVSTIVVFSIFVSTIVVVVVVDDVCGGWVGVRGVRGVLALGVEAPQLRRRLRQRVVAPVLARAPRPLSSPRAACAMRARAKACPRAACAERAREKRAPAPRAPARRVRRRARGPARRSVHRRPCAPKRARAPQPRKVFDKMPVRDLLAWTALVHGRPRPLGPAG
uniref:Uncharacterized protein n=1 Tax=Ananas comosus var. bracteatus TaxID=296719 RepID=A0A6V7QM83_ANACO|nr:unnamed protein product [Ananas comosus var. bracteatus]